MQNKIKQLQEAIKDFELDDLIHLYLEARSGDVNIADKLPETIIDDINDLNNQVRSFLET
jgi:hypothetical protein